MFWVGFAVGAATAVIVLGLVVLAFFAVLGSGEG